MQGQNIGTSGKAVRAIFVIALAGIIPSAVSAQSGDRKTVGSLIRIEGTGADVNAAGASVSVRGSVGEVSIVGAALDVRATVAKGLRAAGAQIIVDSTITGDVRAGGGVIELRGSVGGDVLLGGAVLRYDAAASGNVKAGGAIVDIGPNAVIAGSLRAGAAILNVEGRIAGEVRLGGAVVTFDGNAGGVVHIDADQVIIGPRAVIAGDLIIRSHNDPIVEIGAAISGPIVREAPREWWRLSGWAWKGVFGIAMAVGTFLTGLLLLLVAPGAFNEAVDKATRRPVSSVFIGLATLILLPVFAALVIASVVGITFGLAILLMLPFLLVVGHTVLATSIGAWLLNTRRTDRGLALSLLLLVVGGIVVALIWMIPWVGPALAFILMLIGLGAFFRTFFSRLHRPMEPAF